jgi:hypothetical protein
VKFKREEGDGGEWWNCGESGGECDKIVNE